VGNKGQLKVINNPVYYRIISDKSNSLHLATALWTDQGIDLIDLADHGGQKEPGSGSCL